MENKEFLLEALQKSLKNSESQASYYSECMASYGKRVHDYLVEKRKYEQAIEELNEACENKCCCDQ